MKKKDLLRLYADGERNFRGIRMPGSELEGVDLRGIKLNGAMELAPWR